MAVMISLAPFPRPFPGGHACRTQSLGRARSALIVGHQARGDLNAKHADGALEEPHPGDHADEKITAERLLQSMPNRLKEAPAMLSGK
jgi:hypothetical protein